MMATYKYHIVNRQGERIESNIPDEEQAQTYLSFLVDKHPSEDFHIEKERIYTVTGLGRDPDLH